MAVGFSNTNKPINPRGLDASPKGYNRAALYSGKALDFDGVNDDITIPNSDSINITGNALTIAGYINTDGSTAWQGICYKDSGNQKGFQLFVDKTGDPNIAFGIHTGGFYRLYSNEVIENNKWYFVVATYDGVNQSIYINGVFDNSQTATGNITDSSTENLYIGRNTLGSERFNGEIANFKIFNTALTAAQVADLYNNPEKIVPTGVDNTALKLWLPMMEGAGTTAYDGSSTANDPDLIVNGDFATDSDWTKGTGWTIANGVATHDSSLGPGDLYQDFNLTIGKSYKITIEITATDTTELYFMTDGGDYVEVTGSPIGVHSHVFVADESSHRVGVRGSGNWDGSVDNIKLEGLNFANHGTISGATWTHGIGSPVAQSAVIDWNKTSNIATYSEEFDQWTGYLGGSSSANTTTAPDGQTTADTITFTSNYLAQVYISPNVGSSTYTFSVWAKSDSAKKFRFKIYDGAIDNFSTDITTTSEWVRYSYTLTGAVNNIAIANEIGGVAGSIYVWGASLTASSSVSPYVRTGATAQPTPVLLPQGLTTGRDITGVNLFENVRKQGALNLDGNSWAEVHDNASLDFGTGSFSLEIWSKAKYISSGSIYNVLLTLGDNVSGGSTSSLYIDSSLNYTFRYDGTFIVAGGSSEGDWSHVVGVYDGTNINIYLNGSFVVQTALTATNKTNAFNKIIGTDSSGTSRTYKEQLAQPRIYNRALTASEVLRNYNSGKSTYQ